MNAPHPPRLDLRTSDTIADEVRQRLAWRLRAGDDELLDGLIAVFAHFAGQLGDRLNGAPARQLEAFCDLIGGERFGAVPARTIVAFNPVARMQAQGATPVVRAGTQVVAQPPPGATEPVVFETLAPLALSAVRPARAFVADGALRSWSDASAVIQPLPGAAIDRTQPVARVVSFALPAPAGAPAPSTWHLQIEIDGDVRLPEGAVVQWSLRTKDGELGVVPGVGRYRRTGSQRRSRLS